MDLMDLGDGAFGRDAVWKAAAECEGWALWADACAWQSEGNGEVAMRLARRTPESLRAMRALEWELDGR